MTLTPRVVGILFTAASFELESGTTTQLSGVGGVRVEYAIPLVPNPVATHVPFAKIIPLTSLPKMVGENEVGIPTHDSAVGGLAREYEILFVPTPTATHAPFP
jgi:hypothetical protein